MTRNIESRAEALVRAGRRPVAAISNHLDKNSACVYNNAYIVASHKKKTKEVPMRKKQSIVVAALICVLAALFVLGSCGKPGKKETVLVSYRLNSLDGVIAQTNVSLDNTVSNDTMASLKIEAPSSMNVSVFEFIVGTNNIEDSKVIYRAALRSEKLSGRAYLLMSVHYPDGMETYSRGFEQALIGTVPWFTEDISSVIEKGKKPDKIKMGVVIEGAGTVWIDDIKLLKAPPPSKLDKRR
jgi:hypothetical protein